jgi:hypothetical protein
MTMTDSVIDFTETVRRRLLKSRPVDNFGVTPSETFELVRAYSQIKDPAARQTALEGLKKIVVAQN